MSVGGHVFWLFGLSGAGKSTLAQALQASWHAHRGERALVLDGDRLRLGLCRGLGFSHEDRTENLRRAAEVARLGVESGLAVIAAFITPRESQRQAVDSIVGTGRVSFIYVDAALEVCQSRDVKGLYARARAQPDSQMTGMGSLFEEPGRFDLKISTATETPPASAARLWEFAQTRA